MRKSLEIEWKPLANAPPTDAQQEQGDQDDDEAREAPAVDVLAHLIDSKGGFSGFCRFSSCFLVRNPGYRPHLHLGLQVLEQVGITFAQSLFKSSTLSRLHAF